MEKVKIKQSATKIDRDSRMRYFMSKLEKLDQKSREYANAITAEKRFLTSHYPAIRTRSRIYAQYREALGNTGFHHSFEATKTKLIKKYPHLKEVLMSKTANDVLDNLNQYKKTMKDKTSGEYDAINRLKVAVKAYYTMTLKAGERKTIVEADKMKVVKCKKSKIEVSRQAVKESVEAGLKSKSMYQQAVALALCSGRRPIELFKTGRFEEAEKGKVKFTGQAKQKGSTRKEAFFIPIMHISAKAFLKAFEKFRAITESKGYGELTRERINARLGSELSPVARKMLKNESLSFYNCRAIYAQSAIESAKESGIDTQVYIAEILGHDNDDLVTAMSYESVILSDKAPEKIANIDRTKRKEALPLGVTKDKGKTKTEIKKENKRLAELKKLDVSGLGRACAGLHEWILEYIESNPEQEITQTFITKTRSTSRPAIKKYLEFIGELSSND